MHSKGSEKDSNHSGNKANKWKMGFHEIKQLLLSKGSNQVKEYDRIGRNLLPTHST